MKKKHKMLSHLNKVLIFTFILVSFNLNAQFYTLEHIRASDDAVLGTITDGASITTTSATTFSINAIPSSSIGSTVFSLAGPISHNQIETMAPYALYGDINGSGDFESSVNLITGSYALTVTAWSGSEGTGTQIAQDVINFIVTDSITDTQSPTVPSLSSTSQTETTVDLSWTAATDNVAVTGYKIYKDGLLETTLGNILTYQVNSLTANTSYNFTVTALDTATNESITSNIVTITTNTESINSSCNTPIETNLSDLDWVSVVSPMATKKNTNLYGSDLLMINGQTFSHGIATHSYSEIIYNLAGNYETFVSYIGIDDSASNNSLSSVQFEVLGDGLSLFRSVTKEAADPAQLIEVDVTGVNELKLLVHGSGSVHWGHADWANAILRYCPDIEAPVVPTLSSTSQTETTVDLSWTAATDNVGVTGYKIYKDGVLEATLGNVLSYQVTGLAATTSYDFTVTALDAASNESINSSVLNLTTTPSVNLLNINGWTEGSGTIPGFNQYGTDDENIREIGDGPHGSSSILWKSIPNDTDSWKAGGWDTNYFEINNTKSYRFTVWAKKLNSKDGEIYFSFSTQWVSGTNSVTRLDGTEITDPYFLVGDLPTIGHWYLLVGYVHHNGYNNTSHLGGIYDGITGYKMTGCSDYVFKSTAAQMKQRINVRSNDNTSDTQLFYGPTVYEITGYEPTIEELINAQPNNNTGNPTNDGSGNWSLNNQDLFYTNGNVGIGTTIPDSKLTVKGSIHSEEVKVDLSVPAPDYVFARDYNLTPLEKLQEYIKNYRHLPNIPSAKDMEANGVQLGVMNMMLLEKIEELTLYTLQQQKELKSQKETNKGLENRLIKLESLIKNQEK